MAEIPSPQDDIEAVLAAVVTRALPGTRQIEGLRRLTGGGTQENWAFDAIGENGSAPLILRRAPGNLDCDTWTVSVPKPTEAELIRRAAVVGVPSPGVRHVLGASDGLGTGFIMDRVEGETFARRILRDPEYARARNSMTGAYGEILARIQRVDTTGVPDLPVLPAAAQVARHRAIYEGLNEPHPVFEVAIRWLEDHLPPSSAPVLVHGDFRNGNFIVGPEGVRAVIDWEFAHVGDAMEDLGWLCINAWRFGSDRPVGGFGERETLYAAYEAAGGAAVDRAGMRFWEVFGCLKYGLLCKLFVTRHVIGVDSSIELAYVGRRTGESEIDILNLLATNAHGPE